MNEFMKPKTKQAVDLIRAAKELPASRRNLIKTLHEHGFFVSHTRDDYTFIRQHIVPSIGRTFSQPGESYFLQNGAMPASREYERLVGQALLSCRNFLVVISRAALGSEWMPAELDLAAHRRMPTIICRLDVTDPSDLHKSLSPKRAIQFWKRQHVTINFDQDLSVSVKELEKALKQRQFW